MRTLCDNHIYVRADDIFPVKFYGNLPVQSEWQKGVRYFKIGSGLKMEINLCRISREFF